MKISAWCHTDTGLKRSSNQDAFLIDQDLGLYIVADGMGGHLGGEVASQLAVESTHKFIKKNARSQQRPRDLLNYAYLESSHIIFDKAKYDNPELEGMGTTMVLAYQWKNNLYIGNVGDSRAYMFRAPYLWQVTEDHSLVNEQLKSGVRPEQISVGKNVITRSVGFERDVIPDILERPLMKGDHFLLCSDGFCGLVNDEHTLQILNSTRPEQVVSQCVEAALQAGGLDNVTVMYLSVS